MQRDKFLFELLFCTEVTIVRMRLFRFFFIALVLYGGFKAFRIWNRQTDGFSIEKIQPPYALAPANSMPSCEELKQVNAVLEQEFFYLGKGFQCYAFESADGQYVLKFFRHQRLQLPYIYKLVEDIPPFTKKVAALTRERKRRKNHLLRGFTLAFEQAKEETALVYVHLAKTARCHPPIALFDKAKNRYVVDLNGIEFLIQRKAKHIKPTFDALMAEGRVDEAKKRIDQIFELLVSCAKRGIQDTDKALIRKNNLGFLSERAIYIDTGKLALRENIKTKQGFITDLKRLIPLYEWLKKNHPELGNYFKEKEREVIDTVS
jgi:hypothetical protein